MHSKGQDIVEGYSLWPYEVVLEIISKAGMTEIVCGLRKEI